MALKKYREAAHTASIIAQEEQNAGQVSHVNNLRGQGIVAAEGWEACPLPTREVI